MLFPENESQRLEILNQYQILDTPAEEVFDELAQLAANLCETPIALISLVDAEREWFKSKIGVTISEIPRSISFASYTILQSQILIIPDTLQDERFTTNLFVISNHYFRFYAGVPLITSSGFALGSLGVIDFLPRNLSLKEQIALQQLARQVIRYFELHRQKLIDDSQKSFNLLRLERNLQESEARFRAISEVIPVPLIISRVSDGLILYANPELLQTFCFSPEDLVNPKNLLNLYHDLADLEALLELLNQHGFIHNYELQLKRADGTYFWAIASLQYLNFNNESAILTVFYDINDRKNAETKLQEQNEFLRIIFESIPLMIALIDSNGKLQWVNQEWENILGWKFQDFQTRDVLEALYPNPEYRQYVINFMQTAQRNWGDFITQVRDGRLLDTSWTNVYLSNGQIIAIGQDITERKRTELALKAQAKREQLMRTVAQRIRQSLNLQDILNATVQEVRDLLGVDRVLVYQFDSEMSGTIMAESVKPGWTVSLGVQIHDTCFQTGTGVEYYQGRKRAIANIYEAGLTDCHIRLLEQFGVKANLVVPILLEVSSQNPGSHLWGLLVAHQCSDFRQWEENQLDLLDQLTVQLAIAIQQSSIFEHAQTELVQRQKAQVKLKNALAEKEVLLKEVHHRVKNNLQIVSSLLQLQSQTLKDPEVIKVLRESQNRIESISLIHKNLYTSPNIGQIDVADYIHNLATSLLISYQIYPGKIALETDIDSVRLNVDQAIACGLVINELISNALKHAFPNQQAGTISITLRNIGNSIEMTIRDDGIGLPDNLDWTNTDSLGLSLVYDLVTEQLEGDITLERNHGTGFTIQFTQLNLH
jgi:PAS domain S-box-containing protein